MNRRQFLKSSGAAALALSTLPNYAAEFGFATAGVVNIVTKSGTNDLRGSLFAYHRNESLNARNYFETHDIFDNRISPRLFQRFSGTHSIVKVAARARSRDRYTFLDRFDDAAARLALDENRNAAEPDKPKVWLLMTPYTS